MRLDTLQSILAVIERIEGFSLTRTKILLHLYKARHATGGQIAKAIRYKSGGYTRHIGRLRREGLIVQLTRGFYEISPEGEKLINAITKKLK